jgi:hypothetical protein
MADKPIERKPETLQIENEPRTAETDAMETSRRIMKRLVETPHQPHQALGKRLSRDASPTPKAKEPTPKAKERLASKGRVHKGKAHR